MIAGGLRGFDANGDSLGDSRTANPSVKDSVKVCVNLGGDQSVGLCPMILSGLMASGFQSMNS
jgi:hypothetical protein